MALAALERLKPDWAIPFREAVMLGPLLSRSEAGAKG
jgi:hypothetical protein